MLLINKKDFALSSDRRLVKVSDVATAKTAEEITTALGFGGKQSVNDFCKAMIEQIPEVDPSVSLTNANCVVVNERQNIELKDQFVSDISNYYKGEVMELDFSSSNALKAVNDWSNRHTGGMIPKLMDQLNEDAALMLMNAISFKATWTEKFDEKDTQTETFTKEDGARSLTAIRSSCLMALAINGA